MLQTIAELTVRMRNAKQLGVLTYVNS